MLTGMKAMILAAGVGSRLKELTQSTPKCLMQAGGKTLLEHVITKLKSAGVTELTINLHHHPQQVLSYLAGQGNFGLPIHLSYEAQLLDTGGALKKVRAFFEHERAFIVHNADIYCTSNVQQLVDQHLAHNAIATLAVMQRDSKRGLFFTDSMQLSGWTEEPRGAATPATSPAGTLLAFGGISVCSGELFSFMDTRDTFSIIEPFLSAARSTGRVFGASISANDWTDIGTPESLKALQATLGS
jgi:MurNAc alpha-1-phosphate uridylyltransferase